MATSLCKCGSLRELLTSSSANNPGRQYYRCGDCGAFEWADGIGSPHRKIFDSNAGPLCHCGKASVQRTVKKITSPNRGRKFWGCAQYPRGCKFFQLREVESSNQQIDCEISMASPRKLTMSPEPEPEPERKRELLPGYATWLSDWKKLEIVQQLMEVDADLMSMSSGGRCDKLEVCGLWHITNPVRKERFEEAKQRVKTNTPKISEYGFPDNFYDAMSALSMDSLDEESGECFLLHGTSPENLHGILFEGLDPGIAHNGIFGRGVYFAENAAKSDMYTTKDVRYDKEGSLCELHHKIYAYSHHPHNVRYALICRVLLGRHTMTQNGVTRYDDDVAERAELGKLNYAFTSKERRALAKSSDGLSPSSLIGLPGELVLNFREFIIFNPDQIFVEYLVAYKRVRSRCDCGKPCEERSVVKRTENFGRPFQFCPDNKCSFMQMLPLCDCGKSAVVKTSHSARNPGRDYYTCYSKRYPRRGYGGGIACDFFEWKDNNFPATSPHKRARADCS